MAWTRVVAVLFVCTQFTGCSTLERFRHSSSDAVDAEFEISGRLAVKFSEQGSSAKIKWVHRNEVDTVDVLTPVGSIIAVILVSPRSGAVLETPDKIYEATSAEELTREVLGWSFPLEGLKFWARGLIDPKSRIARISPRDEQGRLTYLEQSGWKITYEKYQENSALPRVMRLSYDDLKLKFVVDTWSRIDS